MTEKLEPSVGPGYIQALSLTVYAFEVLAVADALHVRAFSNGTTIVRK